MQALREILRDSFAKSMSALSSEDRIRAGWSIVCGRTMAERGKVIGYQDGTVRIAVSTLTWLKQMAAMKEVLRSEMERIAGVPVSKLHFELSKSDKVPDAGEKDE